MDLQVLNNAAQAVIFITGAVSIYLLSRNDRLSKWGMVFGLAAQPFYFFTLWFTKSWGMFFLSLIYTIMYANGIKNWFSKRKQ